MKELLLPSYNGPMKPRFVGPIGNRVSCVAGIPGNPLVYYAGAASGGIWKTTDGGTQWESLFDKPALSKNGGIHPTQVSSIGAIAISESNPNIIWAGTGESWIRGPLSIGNGIYKSIDGGANWTHMGLDDTGRFSAVVIHPSNPDIIWAAAVGTCYTPSDWRGVFKTIDGGMTWEKVLFVDRNTGCSDLTIDPNNPAVLYAGMWQFKLKGYIRVSGGPGSGLYKSVDGGKSWKELTNGLPTANNVVGKIAVSVARSDSNYVYANIETGDGEPTWDFPKVGNGQLWQSTDAGENWEVRNYNRAINARAAYYTRNMVAPDNKHEAYFFGPKFVSTVDGGLNLTIKGWPKSPGSDHHQGWIDPLNSNRMIIAHDAGLSISKDRGENWYKIQLPIGQIYHLSVDQDIPYNLYGNLQDRDATWGPSNSRRPQDEANDPTDVGVIPRSLWRFAGGGETGRSIPDPLDKDLIWSSGSSIGPNGGIINIINRRLGHWQNISVSSDFIMGYAPKDAPLRFHWNFPVTHAKHKIENPETKEPAIMTFAGSQFVHATIDRGNTWIKISKRLTDEDDRFLQSSGGITGDNLSVRMAYTTSAIAASPTEAGLIWVGTRDQKLWLGRQSEKDIWDWQFEEIDFKSKADDLPWWDKLSHPDEPIWGIISAILPSNTEKGTLYISFDFHQSGDFRPYIYKVSDYGKNWTKITSGIPNSHLSYVYCLAQDTKAPKLLFAGTQNALYVSFDEGGEWEVLPGLPPSPVSGIRVQDNFSDLVVSTFGRGFWIYDDITPLRQKAAIDSFTKLHLFEMPRPMYRFTFVADAYNIAPDNDPCAGENPKTPAPINFYLKEASNVDLNFYDEKGELIRSDSQAGVAGLNRYWWDLNSNSTSTIKLRTNAPNQKGIKYCPSGVRPYSSPIAGTSLNWMVPPGDYQVEIKAFIDEEWCISERRKIKVVPDPSALGNQEDIINQNELLRKIWTTLDKVAIAINLIEFIRFQIQQTLSWCENEEAKAVLDHLNSQLLGLEKEFFQMKITGHGEDLARFPAKLVEKLSYLGGMVAQGTNCPTKTQENGYQELNAITEDLIVILDTIKIEITELINPKLNALGLPILLMEVPDSPLCDLFDSSGAF